MYSIELVISSGDKICDILAWADRLICDSIQIISLYVIIVLQMSIMTITIGLDTHIQEATQERVVNQPTGILLPKIAQTSHRLNSDTFSTVVEPRLLVVVALVHRMQVQLNAATLRAGKNGISAIVYIKDNELYMEGTEQGSVTNSLLIEKYLKYIHHLGKKVHLSVPRWCQ